MKPSPEPPAAVAVLDLDIHGAAVRLASACPDLLEELRRDFAWFGATRRPPEPGAPPDVRLELSAVKPAPGRVPARAWLKWRGARIAHQGTTRKVDYDGKALLDYDLGRESGELLGTDRRLLRELGYLAVLSRAGALLDRRGLHRAHGLGFTFRGEGGLLLLPSGGGKSRLALELLKLEGFGLLADDIPLVDARGARASRPRLLAFPLRLGLRPEDSRGIPERFLRDFHRRRFGLKRLVDLDYFRDKVAEEAPLRWVLVGSRPRPGREGGRAPYPAVEPCSKSRAALALAAGMVLGIGLPQVLELMLPAPPCLAGTLALARVALSRLRCALRAVSAASCAAFRLSADPASDARALQAFLLADELRGGRRDRPAARRGLNC